MSMKIRDYALTGLKAGPQDGLEDNPEEGRFEAYASVFGNVDSYGDVVVKGAFAEDLDRWAASRQNIPLLFGHNMADPNFNLGYIEKAEEDDRGLRVTGVLDLRNPYAAQVYRLLKGRRLNQLSFAYDVIDSSESKQGGQTVVELLKLKLYEVSLVTIGANQETEVLAVKANAEALEGGLKAGRVLAQKHIDSLRSAQEAIGAVIAAAEVNDQEKASGHTEVKGQASDEEPEGAKSSAAPEEPRVSPSVHVLAAIFNIYATAYVEKGV